MGQLDDAASVIVGQAVIKNISHATWVAIIVMTLLVVTWAFLIAAVKVTRHLIPIWDLSTFRKVLHCLLLCNEQMIALKL